MNKRLFVDITVTLLSLLAALNAYPQSTGAGAKSPNDNRINTMPAPNVRDLTSHASREIALASPEATGTAVLAIAKEVRPMPQDTEVEVVLVPDVTYAQAYRFGQRVDAFYWIAAKEATFDTLKSAPRKPKGGGCSAGGCGRSDVCQCICWTDGTSCFCTKCF